MYSLFVTAKLIDTDPRTWLADVLRRIDDHPAPACTNCYPGAGANLASTPQP